MSKRTELMSKRTDQAAAVIQQQLNEIINLEVELPAGAFITITKVEVAANLKFVKIWVVCTPADLMGIAFGKLRQKVSHLKFLLGQKLDWQFVPALQFRVDHSYLAVEEVERLIEEIHNEKKKTVRRRKKV